MHLFAAVPTHSGDLAVETTQTIVRIQDMVRNRGGAFQFHYQFGSPVGLVRNALAAGFLMSDADLLLMIDADQAVHPDTIARMIDLDKPVVGCMIPKRRYSFNNIRFPAVDVDQVIHQASEYAGQIITDENGQAELVNGFARAAFVGAGILLVRRQAFIRLMQHCPELKGKCLHAQAYPELKDAGAWGFFNPLENEAGAPIAEDISFCLRWRRAGGEIWADLISPVTHIGRHDFAGIYLDHVRATN
jgi:cellulose synthase/poly-beta-1,6-N-acetylglucosamine synthase-like glycosyltransferase